MYWHAEPAPVVIDQLKSDPAMGLSSSEAELRYHQFGPNELKEAGQKGPWKIFLSQFSSTVVIVLLISTFITGFLGDVKNSISIGVIVFLNAILGFIQENRAEKALLELKKMSVPIVRVRRNGFIQEISAQLIVPGDLVLLEAGNVVPADGRIVEGVNLRTQESALTGESDSIEKRSDLQLDKEVSLAERKNMVYLGTTVTAGRGVVVITETGMRTELGRIASLIQSVPQEKTPLQRRLDQVGHRLALVALGVVAVIFLLGLFRGEDAKLMFLTAVSIAVAAIPEGLPAVVTINLALGSQRMLKKQALIRRLPAVESLGSVTIIGSDKTGTLTQNKMTAVMLDVAGYEVELKGGVPIGSIDREHPSLTLLLMGGSLCNDTLIQPSGTLVGEPTETALTEVATRFGFLKTDLEKKFPRVFEFPFDSFRKRMSTIHKGNLSLELANSSSLVSSHFVFMKGAVDSLLGCCSFVWDQNEKRLIDSNWEKRIKATQDKLASNGMRVLGVAYRLLDSYVPGLAPEQDAIESEMIFLGLIGLIDPLRPEVALAVQTCVEAGIRPMMITGDHPLTARAIAHDLGMKEGALLSGADLEKMNDPELGARVKDISVFARVSPEHKLRIIQALQNQGHVVAMTGDGVNDAPALKKADIGVAMGISGSDVAREASDMVLLDDNFSTIVSAVKEGRVIYENIRKFLRYMLTGNIGEIWLMFLAPFLGMPMPLLPVQILWMNLVTDGLPALALGIEPAEKNVMKHPPIRSNENILGRGMGGQIARLGALVGFVPLAVGFWFWREGNPSWQTMTFTTLIFLHVLMALPFRSEKESFFRIPFFSNTPLLGAILGSFALQFMVVYIPLFQDFFHTVPLSKYELTISLFLSTSVFWMAELEKLIGRKFSWDKK